MRDNRGQLAGLMTRDDVTSAHSGPRPQRYEIWVRGHLGETMRSAFPALRAQRRGEDTVLTGALPDQAACRIGRGVRVAGMPKQHADSAPQPRASEPR